MIVEIELTEPFTDGGRFDAEAVQRGKRERILDVLRALQDVESADETIRPHSDDRSFV